MLPYLQAKWDRFRNNHFIRSIGVLVGGTAFAQGVAVLALPLLTRLYTPEDFGVLALYIGMLGMTSVIACLRLEIAIPLPEEDAEAASLLVLSLISAAVFGVLTALIVLTWGHEVASLLNAPALEPYLWLLPIGIWVAASYSAVQFWGTRKKDFSTIASTRMTQAIGGSGVQLGMGWWGVAPLGLLLGQLIKSGGGIFGLGRKIFLIDREAFKKVSFRGAVQTLRKYKRFPKYSALEAFANSAGMQLPVLIIASLAAGKEVGYLLLAMQVMAAPLSLVGGAVSQVFLAHAPTYDRRGELGPFTARTVAGLVKVGVGPLIFVGLISPVAFPLVFGSEWQRAGYLVAWMTPWFIAQLLSSPVSMVLHVTNNQKAALALQFLGLLIRSLFVVGASRAAAEYISEAYALSGFLFYALYFFVIKKKSDFTLRMVAEGNGSTTGILLSWTILGVIVLYFAGA